MLALPKVKSLLALPVASEKKQISGYRIKDGGLVILHSRPKRVGQILQMNLSGMTFFCIEQDARECNFSELDLLFLNNKFYLGHIQVEMIYSRRVGQFSSKRQKKVLLYKVRFGDIPMYQKHNLEHFLSEFSYSDKSQ